MPGDFITDDLDQLLDTDEFATSVTYTPTGGEASTINGIFDPEMIEIDPYTGETVTTRPMIVVKTSDVSGIRHKDAFTINGESFEVLKFQSNHGLTEITLNRT